MTTPPEPLEHGRPLVSQDLEESAARAPQARAEAEARKNTIAATATTLAPLLGFLGFVLGANGLLPLNVYTVSFLVLVIVAGAVTAPIYAMKAFHYGTQARGTAKGQVGILVLAILVSLVVIAALLLVLLFLVLLSWGVSGV